MPHIIAAETENEVRVYDAKPKSYKGPVSYELQIDAITVDTRKLSNDQYKRALVIGIKQMIKAGEFKP